MGRNGSGGLRAGSSGGGGSESTASGVSAPSGASGGELSPLTQSKIKFREGRIADGEKYAASIQRKLDRQAQGGAIKRMRPETIQGYRSALAGTRRDIESYKSEINALRNGK